MVFGTSVREIRGEQLPMICIVRELKTRISGYFGHSYRPPVDTRWARLKHRLLAGVKKLGLLTAIYLTNEVRSLAGYPKKRSVSKPQNWVSGSDSERLRSDRDDASDKEQYLVRTGPDDNGFLVRIKGSTVRARVEIVRKLIREHQLPRWVRFEQSAKSLTADDLIKGDVQLWGMAVLMITLASAIGDFVAIRWLITQDLDVIFLLVVFLFGLRTALYALIFAGAFEKLFWLPAIVLGVTHVTAIPFIVWAIILLGHWVFTSLAIEIGLQVLGPLYTIGPEAMHGAVALYILIGMGVVGAVSGHILGTLMYKLFRPQLFPPTFAKPPRVARVGAKRTTRVQSDRYGRRVHFD